METRHSVELASQGRVGYLFKDRVLEVDDFMDAFMAEGRNNIGIARRLWLTDRTVETHIASIMAKLGLHESDEENRRVLTVLTWLGLRRRS